MGDVELMLDAFCLLHLQREILRISCFDGEGGHWGADGRGRRQSAPGGFPDSDGHLSIESVEGGP